MVPFGLSLLPILAACAYLVFRQRRDHGWAGRIGPRHAAAALAVIALYVTARWVTDVAALTGALHELSSPAARKAWPALWALWALPWLALSVIACSEAARDIGHGLGMADLPPGAFEALGWLLLVLAWAVLMALAALPPV